MQAAADQLGGQRVAWVDNGKLDFTESASRMHGLLLLKFAWVWEEPYTIWQVPALVYNVVVVRRARQACLIACLVMARELERGGACH